jgi:hypothetical protein
MDVQSRLFLFFLHTCAAEDFFTKPLVHNADTTYCNELFERCQTTE